MVGRDAERIRDLVDALFVTYGEFAPPGWVRPEHRPTPLDELAARIESGRGRMVEDEGRSVAHVLWTAASRSRLADPDPDLAYLWQLFVDVPLQGTGIARELHDWALADARAAGFDRIRLLTPAMNARARRFYEREGWLLIGGWGRDEALDLDLSLYERGLAE